MEKKKEKEKLGRQRGENGKKKREKYGGEIEGSFDQAWRKHVTRSCAAAPRPMSVSQETGANQTWSRGHGFGCGCLALDCDRVWVRSSLSRR